MTHAHANPYQTDFAFYIEQAQVLLEVAPLVFHSGLFAMKGGTAINLFLQDMPRLSMDIDCVYTPVDQPRDAAFDAIHHTLSEIVREAHRLGFEAFLEDEQAAQKIFVKKDGGPALKIEVNPIARGTVLPTVVRTLTPAAEAIFGQNLAVPLLDPDEIYAGKFAATLTRTHPRDLYDTWKFFETWDGHFTTQQVDTTLVTILCGNRPLQETLFRDVFHEDEKTFQNVTLSTLREPCDFETLRPVGKRLQAELCKALTPAQKRFLVDFHAGHPNWTDLSVPDAQRLPAIRWKAMNLAKLKALNPAKFEAQIEAIQSALAKSNWE